jgi:hypothetical protein
MKVYHTHENQGCVGESSRSPHADLSAVTRLILDRMARCNYMIERHREGITLNSRRIAQLRAKLASIGVRK